MATSPNFSWPEPDNTDLVKNGALAIRTAINAIDTSMVDLKGGTTGQVLSKASATDMDFSWVTDATGIPATIFDAKGDIIAATAADTAGRLAVGTNGQTLVADSSTATGLKWATPASGGKVLQVVSATYSTTVSTGSNSYIDSGLTASITPTLSTSKVLVLVMQPGGCWATSAATAVSLYVKLMRGATDLTTTSNGQLFIGGASSSLLELDANINFSYLDSPATTSSTTYKTQMKAGNAGTAQVQPNSSISTIILMEIGA